MHWVVQENMFWEPAVERLVMTLRDRGIAHTPVTVVPFDGGLAQEPDISGPIVVVGSTSLARHALRQGWTPGAWIAAESFGYAAYIRAFDDLMLNADARVVRFADALDHDMETFFIRPDDDGKLFAGTVVDRAGMAEWQEKIAAADATWTITPETPVIVSPLKTILTESRFVVVDGEVVTGSLYKSGGHVRYDPRLPEGVEAFARQQAKTWTPDRVCVLDVAETDRGLRIVEFNSFNSAGWYDCDVPKIVAAIEGLA